MLQCETDLCLFTKHDANKKLILWAVTYIDDVMYGGMESETTSLKKQVTECIAITEMGRSDMHLGVHHLLKGNKCGSFKCPMKKYIKNMNNKEATHVKHAHNIYNGTFHHTIGEGVESINDMRPDEGKCDSGRATESDGTDEGGTETANDSFRSDSDELGID